MVAAFEGWNDAGEAASGARRRTWSEVWDADAGRRARPGGLLRLPGQPARRWRSTTAAPRGSPGRPPGCLSPRPPGADRDVVLVRGHRAAHALAVVLRRSCSGYAERLGVDHGRHRSARCSPTRRTPGPIPVSDDHRRRRAGRPARRWSRRTYEGPTGIVGVLQDACAEAGLPAVSLLGGGAALRRAAALAPRPRWRCCTSVEELLDVTVPLGDLPEEARAWERGVDELAERGRARSPSTSGSWRRPRTPPTCRRPAARRSPGSSSATCAAATTAHRPGPLSGPSPRRAGRRAGRRRPRARRERRTPSRASAVPATRPGRRSPTAGGAELRVGPARRRRARAPRGVEVVGERARAPRRARARRRRTGRRRRRHGRPASGASRCCASASASVGPLPVRAVVVGRAAPAGSPSGRRPRRAAGRRSTRLPAGLAHLLAVQPDHAGVHVDLRERPRAGRAPAPATAPISWCGKTRSEPPPCTSNAMPEVLQGDRRALDVPAGPAAAERAAVPGRLAGRARPATAAQSSGCCLPGRSGSPPRSANSSQHRRARPGRTPRRSRGSACDGEVDVAVGLAVGPGDPVGRARRRAAARRRRRRAGCASTAPM